MSVVGLKFGNRIKPFALFSAKIPDKGIASIKAITVYDTIAILETDDAVVPVDENDFEKLELFGSIIYFDGKAINCRSIDAAKLAFEELNAMRLNALKVHEPY